VDSRGENYDNALAEMINGLFKAELIHRTATWTSNESPELELGLVLPHVTP
jgi:hypothetical protein